MIDSQLRTIIRATGLHRVAEIVTAMLENDGEDDDGWEVWNEEGLPAGDWFMWNNRIYRKKPTFITTHNKKVSARPVSAQTSSVEALCPFCGVKAFPQDVCPSCAKGRAGIRKMWVCGENTDHVFYTE